MPKKKEEELYTISQLRKELNLPIVLAKRLITFGHVLAYKAEDGRLYIPKNEVEKVRGYLKKPGNSFKLYLRALGPGIITGASDDDPGGIGTYSSVGARFGFAILWMALWLLPLMIAIQEVCARIGIVTNSGLAKVLAKHYAKKTVFMAAMLLLIANIVNIGADINAMSASLSMITGINFLAASLLFGVVTVLAEVFIPYATYSRILKWLVLSVLSYVVTGLIIRPDWGEVIKFSFLPSIQFTKEYFFGMIAVFGTTITPYLFFWQTSAEVEANKHSHKKRDGHWTHTKIRRMRTDVVTGMILANVVFYFIIVTAASLFHKNNILEINTAQEAAEILRPLAGEYAYLLFSLGIIGSGLLAIPVLAGSGSYAIAEVFKWHEGFNQTFRHARGFYLVIAASIALGVLMNLFEISPIKALYYSAFLNGIISFPLMILIMVIGNDKKIMGEETHSKPVFLFGWFAIFIMLALIIGAAWLHL